VRTTHHFSINDPLTSFFEEQDLGARLGRMNPDPFNAKQFVWPHDEDDPGDIPFVLSIVDMPGAAPQPWSRPRPGVPVGKVEVHRLRSGILDNERRVWLYTPPG